jgi:hypothetical protein
MADGVNFEDITVHWGTAPDQLDQHMFRWRQAVFQDVAITGDHRFMYYLYDPIADENSGTRFASVFNINMGMCL